MKRCWRDVFLIVFVCFGSTFLIWLPFFLRLTSFWKIPLPAEGMVTIMKNFDGPYYIAIAKSFYNPQIIGSQFSFDLPQEYYAAHFPLYPLLIRIGATFLNYLWSMISITLVASALAAFTFYRLVKDFKFSKNPLWLTVLFLLFPARWLVVRSVGSPEPLFILMLLASFYFFKKQNYWLAGVFGALTQLTKPPGILLFAAYGVYLLWQTWGRRFPFKAYPLLLIPLSLLGVFGYYGYVYDDFLAYFHSGDNIHLFWPPLQVFNVAATWVGTFWLEEIIYIYLIGILGVVLLFKQKRYPLAFFTLVFFSSTMFISHRDMSRYSLPLVPFLLIAFEKFLTKKEFKIAFAVILLPIFLYAINFIAGNTLEIADWAPFH